MTDRLTDAELDALDFDINGVVPIDQHDLARLIAEVREHRAARTLTDEERDAVAVLRSFVPLDPSSAARQRCITLIDRFTEETCGD